MDGFDFDTYHQLYLSSGTLPGAGQQGAAPFFQPPPPPPTQPQAPMMGQCVGDPAGYVAAQGYSVLPQQIPGGGIWAGNDARFVPGPSGVLQDQPWAAAAAEDDSMMLGGGDWEGSGEVAHGQAWAAEQAGDSMLGGDAFPGNDQFVHGGGFPGLEGLVMGDLDLTDFDDSLLDEPLDWDFLNSLAENQDPSGATSYALPMVPEAEPNQPASDSSSPSTQLGAGESPGLTSQMPAYPPVMDYPQAPPEFVHDGGVPSVQGLLMGDFDLSELDDAAVNSLWESSDFMNSMAAIEAAAHPSCATEYAPPIVPASDSSSPGTQAGAAESPGLTSQMGAYLPVMDCQQPPVDRPQAVAQIVGVAAESPGLTSQMPAHPPAADYPPASVDTPQTVADYEDALVAQMVGVALRCDDKVSTDWSEEENQVLREGLSRFAGQDNINKCFSIASGLANKTVTDVAYRIRWLSDLEKKRTAKQAQLEQEKSARGNVTNKGKGTKGATRKNNKYPLSKEVLNSKSAKDLILDNGKLMYKIEEILRTRQVKDSADYFYNVKMTMDALQNKVTNMSTVMEGRSVGDDEWEDVLKDRQPLAGKDTATLHEHR
ncbi:unnamed protein product [Alopecurus aequalis]